MPPGRNIERPERAEFKPLPPDLNIPHLIQSTPNFEHVIRIDARNINSSTIPDVEAYVHDHVIKKGLPLVIENWHLRSDFPSWIFCVQWLIENHGPDRINVRDLKSKDDIPMTFGHYLNNLRKLSSKFHRYNFDGNSKQQRLYAKDLDCPSVWRRALSEILPESTFYLSPMADLMSSLPEAARAENMMCYVGHEGTYTPAHKEMCASLGQNIMVAASTEDEHPSNRVGAAGSEGSSVWFMMGREDREVIAEYWLAHLGHDIEVESHFASVEDLANAPFTVYIVEQKIGDYILVPPLAPHQVWNRGEYTIKAAWNRTTVDTLEFSIKESLPKARLVCRDEQYKNKAIIYETLLQYLKALKSDNDGQSPEYIKALRGRKSLANDFVRLFDLFNIILLDQCFDAPGSGEDKEGIKIDKIDNEYNVTCSFCRCNIWNRFLSCEKCVVQSEDGDDDCYDVCLECYARGRSCGCQSGLKWVEQEDWSELLDSHEAFLNMVIEIQGVVSSNTPKRFTDALVALPRKTIARVCLEQNKLRPFVDVTKDAALESEDDAATIARKKKSGELLNCHVCKVRHERWKCAACSTPGCPKAYCYGNLWRAFDMDPADDVLVQFNWKCPFCLRICSCGACQKNPKMNPHHPRGTFLGADTKHVVDPRSVEILVDFKRGNLSWLKPGEVDLMTRLKRKRTEEQDGDDTDSPKTSYSHSWSVINEDSGINYEDTTLRRCSIPLDPVLARSMDEEETNGRETNKVDVNDCSDKNSSNDRNGHENSLLFGDKIGGGQYTLSPKPLANHHLGKQTPIEQVIEMEESRLQRGEARDIKTSGGGGDVMQQGRHSKLTLPSPSAMLAGALPTRHSSPEPSPDCSYVSTHINQHSYPYILSTEKPHLRNRSCGNTSNTDTPNEDTHLSTLEKNPIAFIAAAGLMQISNDHNHSFPVPVPVPPPPSWPHAHPSTTMVVANTQPNYHSGNHPTLSASGLGMGAVVVPESGDHVKGLSHVSSNSNIHSPVHISHPHFPLSNSQITPLYPPIRYTPMLTTPKPPPIPAPLPPSLIFNPNAESLKYKRKKDHLGKDLFTMNVGDSERDTTKLSWVKQQQKLAKERKRLRQIRKKTKFVVLQINSEKLKALEDEWKAKKVVTSTAAQFPIIEVGDDLVTTDLDFKPATQGQEQPITENTLKSDSPLKQRKRVAPGWVEISDDEDTDQSSITPDDVVGACDREDGEYRGWGARQFRKNRQAATIPLQRNRRIFNRKEIREEASIRSNISEESIVSCDPTTETIDPYVTLAHQRVEHGLAVDEDAKKKVEAEVNAELNLQVKSEEEAELARKRKGVEENAVQDAIQWELEQERRRKEQVARAYRESKLCALKVAAGEDPFETWGGSWDGSCDDSQDVAQGVPLLPVLSQEKDFAVVINVSTLIDRGLYEPLLNLEYNDYLDLSVDLNTPQQVPDPKTPPPSIRNKRQGRATRSTEGTSMITTPIRSRTTASSTSTTCPPAISITRANFPRKPRPRKPREDDIYKSMRPFHSHGQKQAMPADDKLARLSKRRRPRSISSTCLNSPTESKLHSTETDLPTPSRVSSRKRKVLSQNYNFDTDEESHVTRSVSISQEIPNMIDLELDPDLGALEREREKQARLKEREDQQKRSQRTLRIDSNTYESHAHGQEIEEQLDINLEDEYSSRWRRRTARW